MAVPLRMPPERFDDVVATLCAAFRDYPVMRYILKDAGEAYDERLRTLIGYFTDARFSRSWPVLGVEADGEILAAANVNPPETLPPPPSLQERYQRLCGEIGDRAMERFRAFGEACDALEPEEPHYYLGMIGVRPEGQGRGLGRVLLDAVHTLSADDPASTGVALSTETEDNRRLYEHFGYRLVGEGRVEELVTWTLFRPDGL